jgi:soluble lytic murein transglycosylase
MTLGVRFVKNAGLILSKPLSIILLLIYLGQTAFMVYVMNDRHKKDLFIQEQQKKIGELEEKLKIFKIIEDFQVGFNTEEVGKLTSVVFSESERYGYHPLLLLALIKTESSFRQGQESVYGAQGLLQVKPSVGQDVASRSKLRWKGEKPLFDSEFNIRVGSLYLFELILKFQDVKKAIIAYNQGEGSLRLKLKSGQVLPKFFYQRFVHNYNFLKARYDQISVDKI